MTIKEIIIEALEAYNKSIADTISEKKLYHTGEAKNSLNVEDRGEVFVSVGAYYIEYLNRGSGPWNNPENFAKLGYILGEITNWAADNLANPYAAAKVIAEQGSRIYRNRELGLKLEDKKMELEEELNKLLPTFVSNEIVVKLSKALLKLKGK